MNEFKPAFSWQQKPVNQSETNLDRSEQTIVPDANLSPVEITPETQAPAEILSSVGQSSKADVDPVDQVSMTFKVSKKERSSWKVYAAQNNITMTDLIKDAVNKFVK